MLEKTRDDNLKIEDSARSIFQIINDNGILSSIAASIIFAILAYFVTSPERKLVYKTNFHLEVLNLEKNPDFSLVYQDSLTIKKNLYLVSISFWNDGKTPIISSDLRRELTISLDSTDTKILGAIEINESHKDITQTKVKISDAKNEISMRFDFLERGNKIELKFYYASPSRSSMDMDTYITGGKNIEKSNTVFKPLVNIILTFLIWFLFIKKLSAFVKNNKYLSDRPKGKSIKDTIIGILFITLIIGSLLGIALIVSEVVNSFFPFSF